MVHPFLLLSTHALHTFNNHISPTIMKIHEWLLANPTKIQSYFNDQSLEKWIADYKKKATSIEHDEPWLTLVALFSIFSEQNNNSDNKVITALEKLLRGTKANWDGKIIAIKKVKVEVQVKEIQSYREKLISLAEHPYHLYPDRNMILQEKFEKGNASFEGNTNLDVYIELECNKGIVAVLIEAKFLSDISSR